MQNDLISKSALISEFEWLKSVVNKTRKDEVQETIQRIENAPAVNTVDIEKALAWLEDYSILDRHEVYTNGVLLVPLFRVEQALVHKAYNGLQEG